MLEDLEKQEPKYKWYYDQLRRYGKTGNDFTIESGRRSESGEGIFVFMHEIVKSLSEEMKCNIIMDFSSLFSKRSRE